MANWKLMLVILAGIIVFAVILALFVGYYGFMEVSSFKLNKMLSAIFSFISWKIYILEPKIIYIRVVTT